MKLLISRKLPDPVIDAARLCAEVDIRDNTHPMSQAEMVDALQSYDVILPTLGDQFSQQVFEASMPMRCKLLANFGVGYNHIDVSAAASQGILVSNTPGAVTDATADIALGLILMTCRRLGEGERMLRSGNWQGWHPTQMLGMHLGGKTVGIIGMGRIGQAIAKRCHFGFGMDVVYFNRSQKNIDTPSAQLDRLADVMAKSDVVVLAIPGGADTFHFIDAQALSHMKPSAFLINIARGDVMDETALIAALQSGQIAGAGLDVYEHEPKVPDALKVMEKVVLLPHLGTAALNVRTDMGLMAVSNVKAFVEGKELPNAV